jgi:transcriptional regulator GlxA family with amidase domain
MPASSRTVFVAFDDFQSLDLTGPWEVLHTAARLTDTLGEHELLVATAGARPVASASGLRTSADLDATDAAALEAIGPINTLIVVGGTGVEAAARERELVAGIRAMAAAARRVASVCTGAFLLAEAGLLDGRRATTHWASCELLARRYPAVTVEPDPIFVRDGVLITSAGVTSGIDLALALVEEDHGPRVALDVARWLVVYARRPGGQAQFSVQLASQASSLEPLVELQSWVGEHLDADLSVRALADRMHLSTRQLARVFRRELGTTPADYVERARLECARTELEAGSRGVEEIARRCGFASAEVMRRAFRRRLGTNPREYRARFRIAA